MNFEKVQRKNRKAISPVLATVILIAITLIAAVAIAGFVFGLFGSFTSSAQVSAQVTSCTKTAGAPPTTLICTVTLTNSGTANAQVNACSINVNGNAQPGTNSAATVTAGSTLAGVTCTTTATFTEPALGSQAVGSLSMSNGASVPFSGVWS